MLAAYLRALSARDLLAFNRSKNALVLGAIRAVAGFSTSSSSAGNWRLPLSAVDFKFVRSSGPGGQHVNKVSTACEARVNVARLSLPEAVLARLLEQQKNRINNNMELVVDSQAERSQHRNRERCIEKLQYCFDQAFIEPKERIVQVAPPDKTKEKWREEKRHRKELKESRKKFKDYDKYL